MIFQAIYGTRKSAPTGITEQEAISASFAT